MFFEHLKYEGLLRIAFFEPSPKFWFGIDYKPQHWQLKIENDEKSFYLDCGPIYILIYK